MNVTTRQACEFFDVDKSTLTLWKKAGAQHCYLGRNSWDLKALVLWWVENIYSGPVNEANDDSLAEAKRQYWQAKAERERLKVDAERGEFMSIADIAKNWVFRVSEVTTGLQSLVDRLPPLLEGKSYGEIRAVLADEIWRLRDRYARGDRFCDSELARKVIALVG